MNLEPKTAASVPAPQTPPGEFVAISRALTFVVGVVAGLALGWYLFSPPNHPEDDDLRAVEEIARELIEGLQAYGPLTLEIKEFIDDDDNRTQLGESLRDELTNALKNSSDNLVLGRDELELSDVLDERARQATPLVANTGARGPLAGATATVRGRLRGLTRKVELNVRVTGVDSGETLAAASARFGRSDMINLSLKKKYENGRNSANAWPTFVVQANREALANKFYVRLNGCQISAQTVFCDFEIRNADGPRNFHAFKTSGATPQGTDEVSATGFEIDGKREEKVRVPMEENGSLTIQVAFVGVPPDATRLSEVRLNSHHFRVSFQDVPLKSINIAVPE